MSNLLIQAGKWSDVTSLYSLNGILSSFAFTVKHTPVVYWVHFGSAKRCLSLCERCQTYRGLVYAHTWVKISLGFYVFKTWWTGWINCDVTPGHIVRVCREKANPSEEVGLSSFNLYDCIYRRSSALYTSQHGLLLLKNNSCVCKAWDVCIILLIWGEHFQVWSKF